MRQKRPILWSAGVLVVLIGLALGYYRFILDWEARPFCHKQVMSGFMNWMVDHGMNISSHANFFPNVNGVGRDSLATIREGMNGYMDWAKDYGISRNFVARKGAAFS